MWGCRIQLEGVKSLERRVLALLRHGDYEQPAGVPSAHLPYGLTALGRSQASEAASTLWEFAVEQRLEVDPVVDCSHLRRAWETAALLTEGLSKLSGVAFSVGQYEALAERSVGAAANLTVDAIERAVADDPRYESLPEGWKRSPHFRLPLGGAESLMEAGERVAVHLSNRARSADGPSLKIVVGHGGSLRHAACVLGVLVEEDLHALSMHHCAPVYLEAHEEGGAGAVRFEHVGGAWKQRAQAHVYD